MDKPIPGSLYLFYTAFITTMMPSDQFIFAIAGVHAALLARVEL